MYSNLLDKAVCWGLTHIARAGRLFFLELWRAASLTGLLPSLCCSGHPKWSSAFRNLAYNTMCAPGHRKGKGSTQLDE